MIGKGGLRIAIEDFLSTFKFGDIFADWLEDFSIKVEDSYFDAWGDIFEQARQVAGLESLVPDKNKRGLKKTLAWLPVIIGILIGIGKVILDIVEEPLIINAQRKLNKKLRLTYLDKGELLELIYRYPQESAEAIENLQEMGFSDVRINQLIRISRNALNVSELVNLWLRKEIDTVTLEDELSKLHYVKEDIERIKKLAYYIPTPNDIIRLAVRDAWNDQAANRFGYDEDFPAEFGEWSEKQGLSRYWAKRYWRAHWELPGTTLAYEMYHRLREGRTQNTFTRSDLETLLKIADYPRYFRDRMIEVSYEPFSRVDVRRMYKIGILNYDEVVEAYKDIGYDDKKAKLLADFTVKYETGDEDSILDKYKNQTINLIKEGYLTGLLDKQTCVTKLNALKYSNENVDTLLSLWDFESSIKYTPTYKQEYKKDVKAIIEKAYSNRLINNQEAHKYLTSIGFTEQDIELLLGTIDYAVDLSYLDSQIEVIQEQYVNRLIDENEVVSELGKLNCSGERIKKLLDMWSYKRNAKSRLLTESQYRAAVVQGIITVQDYKKKLDMLGYRDDEINILVKLYGLE